MQIVRDVRFGCDYVDGDVLHVGGGGGLMVSSDDDLLSLPDTYGPGSMAHTAGWKAAWEKGIDGTWVNIKGGADIGS